MMKLIIREYLASLKERDELDALLPDLLSQMGLVVFSKPGRGTKQYGVDIAAFGSLNGEPSKVYLFSIKAGDLGRQDWCSGSPQDLFPSIQQIIHTYIPTHLPSKYSNAPIEICICFGGDIKEQIRLDVSTFEKENSNDKISFSEWGGEELSSHIIKYFLNENLMPMTARHLFRKSLSMLDEPQTSYKYFNNLINSILCIDKSATNETKKDLTSLRQINICLWTLFAWCRESNNLESAYLCSEIVVLRSWEICKKTVGKRGKNAKLIQNVFLSILSLYNNISIQFLNKLLPHFDKLHALSFGIKSANNIDINLKLFDILGRISIYGIWLHWQCIKNSEIGDQEKTKEIQSQLHNCSTAIKELIQFNPILFTPYTDNQAVDMALAIWFLSREPSNRKDLHTWLSEMINRIDLNFQLKSHYPIIFNSYEELIEHPKALENYYKSATASSTLYPMIAMFAVILKFDDIYNQLQALKAKHLTHCNFQLWYPDQLSETHIYINSSIHGTSLVNIDIHESSANFIKQIFDECELNNSFSELSAVKADFWPLILIVCRHYKLPLPPHFIKWLENSQH